MKPHLLFLSVWAIALAACGGEAVRIGVHAQSAAVAVQTTQVTVEDWPATYEATGTVQAGATVVVSSKVTGYVREIGAHVGDHVSAGQIVVTLDARDLESGFARAEAARAETQSAIPESENAIAAAKANLDLAQATYGRMEELAAKRSISNQEMDEASARLKAAQANFEMARSRRVQLNSRIAQAEQEVRSAGIMRDYARLTSPFSGVVVAKSAEPGNLATPGVPLLTIEQDGLYRLEAMVDESRMSMVRLGQTVEAVAGDRKVTARVSEIGPLVDPASRTYIVKLDLPAAPQFRTGMFGRAEFPAGAQKVTVIPAAALIERGQLQSVFAIEDCVAHTRLVSVGRRRGTAVEVLSGLSGGEKIAVSPPQGLRDGSTVEERP